MTTPAWRSQAQDIFNGDEDLALLPRVLSRARSINAQPHETWKSIAFDWMESIYRRKGRLPPDLPLATLRALLDAGLDPHGGRPSFTHLATASARRDQMARHYRMLCAKSSSSDGAFRYSLSAPFRKKPGLQHDTNWLGKILWVARAQPRLVSMIELFLQAGVHPHDQGPHRFANGPTQATGFDEPQEEDGEALVHELLTMPWSAWPTALLTGRLEVLECLAAAAGDAPPPDWVPAVLAVLRKGVGASGDWEGAHEVLSWFTQRYPPTPAQCQAVLAGLWRGNRVYNDDGLALWLSLPAAGLALANGPIGAQSSFNPWACLGYPTERSVVFHDQTLLALATHPKWGNARAVMSCPASARRSFAPATGAGSVLAAWVDDNDKSRPLPIQAHRQRLFDVLDTFPGLHDPALPAFIASLGRAPDARASAWLARNPSVWLGPAPELSGKTPWHFGPGPKIQGWLKDMGVMPSVSDIHGNSGLACGLVAAFRKNDSEAMESMLPWMKGEGVDWSEVVEGRTLKQWAHASSVLAVHAPDSRLRLDVVSLQAALEVNDRAGVVALLKHRRTAGLGAFDDTQSKGLIEAWLSPKFAPNDWSKGLLSPAELAAREKTLAELSPWLSDTLRQTPIAQHQRWLSRCWERTLYHTDPRPDMLRMWEAYGPTSAWSKMDLKALVDWAGQDITLSVVYGSQSVGPWTSGLWAQVPADEKAGLARAVLSTAIHARNAFRVNADYNVGWMEAFMKAFGEVEDIHVGSSLARVKKTVALLEGAVASTHQAQYKALDSMVNSWISEGRVRLLEEKLGKPTPHKFKRRF